ncbi:MAG: hypothetical protein M3Q31_04365 [Actinomycetota bacterium]|nr:hypothetical protein [Actinomycetota bacterium]
MRELDQLAADDPVRVMDLLNLKIRVGEREAYMDEVELLTSATRPPRAYYALRWLDEPVGGFE